MMTANATTAATVPSLEAIAARAGVNAGTLKGLCEEASGGRGQGESVWSFLWRTEPGTLSLMLDPIGGLEEANAKARAMVQRGRKTADRVNVEGVGAVWLVPQAVLERMFPVAA